MSDQNDYRIEIVDTFKQWEELAPVWNQLLTQSMGNTVFLTWEWLYSWAECFFDDARTLFILVVYKEDKIVGIAPWYIQRQKNKVLTLRYLRFLGAPEIGSDYLDIIIKKGQERAVTQCLLNFLLLEGTSRWDCCNFQDVPSDSLFLLYFLEKIESQGKYAEIRPESYCPTVHLPQKGADLLANYGPNRRQQYRRHLKLLQKEGELHHTTQSGANVLSALEAFCSFYEEKNEKHDKMVRPFLMKFASRGGADSYLELDLLTSNGKLVAGMLHVKYGNTLSMYLMAVDKEQYPQVSLGNLFVGMCLSNAIDKGYAVYDFLKGAEPYKFHWANGGRSSVSLFFYRKNVAPVLLAVGKFLRYTAKIIVR